MYTLAELQKNWPLQPEQALDCLNELLANECFTVETSQFVIEEGDDAGLTILQAFAHTGVSHPQVFLLLIEKCPEVVRAHNLNAPIQHGMHKGKSIIWWCAKAAAVGSKPEVFLNFINTLPTAVTSAGLLGQSQGDSDTGISALWWLAWLASAVGGYHPKSFLKALELYPEAITLEGISAQAQIGDDKGQSILWLLAAASNERPKAFMKLIERHPSTITAEGLSAQLQEGNFQGMSALWWLARAAENNEPEPILKLLNELPHTITPEALTAQAAVREESISALWWLANAAANGYPEAFLKALEQHPSVMTLELLTAQPPAGFGIGKTILWWLAEALEKGKADAFLKILTEHSLLITPSLLTQQAQKGIHTGISVLWWLAKAVADGSPAAFLKVMEDYPAAITLEAMTAQGQEGTSKGKSPLWWLASAVASGHPEAFLKVIEQYPSVITVNGLTAQAQQAVDDSEDLDEGKSPLWLLAEAAEKGHPEAFSALLDKMPEKITQEALNAPARKGQDMGKSALHLLAQSCAKGQVVLFLKFMEKKSHAISADTWFGNAILAILLPILDIAALKQLFLQPRDKISLTYLNYIFVAEKPPVSKRTALLTLCQAKNQFLEQLENCENDLQNNNEIHNEQVKILNDLAQEAAKAGYQTAFYEVAGFFEHASVKKYALMEQTAKEAEVLEQTDDDEANKKLTQAQEYQREAKQCLTQAYEHYLKAPADTYHYGVKYLQIASYYYNKAGESEEGPTKKQYLEKALKAALRLEKTDRQRMLQMIAKSYICPKELGLVLELIPAHWLSLINVDTTVEDCFAIFEEKKKQLCTDKAMQDLSEKHEALAQEFSIILQQRDALMVRVAQLESTLVPPALAALSVSTADPQQHTVALTPGYSNSQGNKRKLSGASKHEGPAGKKEKTGKDRKRQEKS